MNTHDIKIMEVKIAAMTGCQTTDTKILASRLHNISLEKLANLNLYIIIPYEYALKSFLSNKLFFKRVSSWEDTYENYMLKNTYSFPSGIDDKSILDHLQNYVYGQSWSMNKESDAMWRIYSADKQGVRMCVNALSLVKCVMSQDSFADLTYAGKVEYCDEDDFEHRIKEDTEDCNLNDLWQNIIPSSYFRKRGCFSHENEFRFIRIFTIDTGDYFNVEMIAYNFDAMSLVNEITFDPRLNPSVYDARKKELIEEVGFSGDIINQSQIYKFSPINIQLQ